MTARKSFLERFSERLGDLDDTNKQAYILRLARDRGFFETVFNAVEVLKLKDELYQILSEHTGKEMDVIRRDADRDFWMTSQEALEYGMIDQIVTKAEKNGKK